MDILKQGTYTLTGFLLAMAYLGSTDTYGEINLDKSVLSLGPHHTFFIKGAAETDASAP